MGLELRGSVSLDGSGFEAGLNRIERATIRAGESLKNIAMQAFGIYGVEQAIHATVERAKELVIQSERLGLTIEQLQVMRQAAKDNNVEFELLTKSFEKFDIAREKILSKSKEGPALMRRMTQLGITEADLKTMTAGQAMLGPIRNAVNSKSQEDVGPILQGLLEIRGVGKLIPFLKTDFEDLQTKMEKLGSIMTTEAAVQVRYLAKEFELLRTIIVAQLAPALSQFAFWVVNKVGDIKGIAGFAGSLVGSAGGTMQAIADEGKYRRLKGQAEIAESLGMTTPGETRSRPGFLDIPGLFKADARVPTVEEAAFMKAYEGRIDAAQGEKTEVADKWKLLMQGIQKQLEEEMERLKHPKPPAFDPSDAVETSGKQKREKHIKDSSDSLIRVGNFLGSSRDSMTTLAERQVNLLQEIATNTRPNVSFGESGVGYPIE